MRKLSSLALVVLIALSLISFACSKGGADMPEPKREYSSVDEYVNDYINFMNAFAAYMKSTLQEDGTIKASDKETAQKWMDAYSAFQMKGFGYKGDDMQKMQESLEASGVGGPFMEAFMPFNSALYSQ
jgi:hypothetical protein